MTQREQRHHAAVSPPCVPPVAAATAEVWDVPCGLEKYLQDREDLNKEEVAVLLGSGAVTVSGAVVRDRAFLVFPDEQADGVSIAVHGKPCAVRRAPVAMWALHKPAGMAVDLSVRAPPGLPRVHRDLHSWLLALREGDNGRSSSMATATSTDGGGSSPSCGGDEGKVGATTESGSECDRKRPRRASDSGCVRSLRPVGRLDRPTSGLLLVQGGHGDLSGAVCAPGTLSKSYEATVKTRTADEPTVAQLTALLGGVELADGFARAAAARVIGRSTTTFGAHVKHEARVFVRVAIGRNHIVRRMLAAVGLGVRRLHRVAIGMASGLELEALGITRPGEAVRLSPEQVEVLWSECGGRAAVRARTVAALHRRVEAGAVEGDDDVVGGQQARLREWLQHDAEQDVSAVRSHKRDLTGARELCTQR